jgi:hypothetical protein
VESNIIDIEANCTRVFPTYLKKFPGSLLKCKKIPENNLALNLISPCGGRGPKNAHTHNVPNTARKKTPTAMMPATGSMAPLPEALIAYPGAEVIQNLTRNLILPDRSVWLFLQMLNTQHGPLLVEKWVKGPLAPQMTLTYQIDTDLRAVLEKIEARYTGLVLSRGDGTSIEGNISSQQYSAEVDILTRTNEQIRRLKAEQQALKEQHRMAIERCHAMHANKYRQLETVAAIAENRSRQLEAIAVAGETRSRNLEANLILAQEQLSAAWSRAAHAEANNLQLREYISLHRQELCPSVDPNNISTSHAETDESIASPLVPSRPVTRTTYSRNYP